MTTHPQLTWQQTIDYFRSRQAVFFYSYARFWEYAPFVQQSLAKVLTENGVKVFWREGDNWRKEKPILHWNSPNLSVKFGSSLPGRSHSNWLRRGDQFLFKFETRRELSQFENPLIWVQAGLREELALTLPYIDVFSTFDDPFHFSDDSILKQAKCVVAQNQFTYDHHFKDQANAILALPPVETAEKLNKEKVENLELPKGFPKKIMGYVGAFFEEDYDLELFEYFVRSLPDWGFILAGRTNPPGQQKVEKLKQYKNFLFIPWVKRSETPAIWKTLRCSLLLHRPRRTQYGAFPTKLLEASYFGVPCVGTHVPKTEGIKNWFEMSSFPSELREKALAAVHLPKEKMSQIYEELSKRMDPKFHLIQVASQLAIPNQHLSLKVA